MKPINMRSSCKDLSPRIGKVKMICNLDKWFSWYFDFKIRFWKIKGKTGTYRLVFSSLTFQTHFASCCDTWWTCRYLTRDLANERTTLGKTIDTSEWEHDTSQINNVRPSLREGWTFNNSVNRRITPFSLFKYRFWFSPGVPVFCLVYVFSIRFRKNPEQFQN
jgi:hypothetical protein